MHNLVGTLPKAIKNFDGGEGEVEVDSYGKNITFESVSCAVDIIIAKTLIGIELKAQQKVKQIESNRLVYGGEVEAYFMKNEIEKLKKDSNDWQPHDSHEKQFQQAYPKLKDEVTKALLKDLKK